MQAEDFMQISQRFHKDFTQNGLRKVSGIVPESFRNPSTSLAESLSALSRPNSMQLEDFMQISRDLTQNGLQNLSGIVAEPLWKRSGIVPESWRTPR